MKKNLYACMDRHRKVMKFVLMMKVTFILSVLLALQAHAGVYSQQILLSMTLENARSSRLLGKLKKNTEYSFVYSDADLKGIASRDVRFKDVSVESILTTCLKGTGLVFSIEENTIVIRKTDAVQGDKVEERVVKGIVTDGGKVPLPGTTVILKGTTVGVVTDTAGRFQIALPKEGKHVLVFSFVGMTKQEVDVTAKDFVTVVMVEDCESLDDVVVTGYMARSKASYAGAVQTVKADQLIATGSTSLIESLKGLIPGLVIRQSGLIGSEPIIKIRGTNRLEESTITGNSAPLSCLTVLS